MLCVLVGEGDSAQLHLSIPGILRNLILKVYYLMLNCLEVCNFLALEVNSSCSYEWRRKKYKICCGIMENKNIHLSFTEDIFNTSSSERCSEKESNKHFQIVMAKSLEKKACTQISLYREIKMQISCLKFMFHSRSFTPGTNLFWFLWGNKFLSVIFTKKL